MSPGVLHNARYLLFFERTLGSFWRHLGWGATLDPAALGFAIPTARGEDRDVLAALLGTADDAAAQQRDQLSDADLGSMESEFQVVAVLSDRKKDLEAELKEISSQLDAAKERMRAVMDAHGTTQFRSGAGLGSCFVQERFDTTLEDPAAFVAWISERHPELLTVNSQTRNRLIREEYRDKGVAPDSEEFPPGIKVTPRPQLAVRGARPQRS